MARRNMPDIAATPFPSLKDGPRILMGIDPGTRFVGWGVIRARGSLLQLLDCGVLKAPLKQPIARRLAFIFEGLEGVIGKYDLFAGAVEETFAGNNPKSAIAMGQGRGVALLALARGEVPILELSPAEVKKAVTGNGCATKDLVARMVTARLELTGLAETEDVTDALALAIALAHRVPIQSSWGPRKA